MLCFILDALLKRKEEKMKLTDQEVLFKAMQFCLKHKKENCYKCPLNHRLCISNNGDLILGEKDRDDHINFVKFTEQFRELIKTISED